MTDKLAREKEDRVRAFLTVYITMQAFLLIIFFGSAPFLHLKISSDEAMGIVELVLPLLTGYVGLMLGFYFGTREQK